MPVPARFDQAMPLKVTQMFGDLYLGFLQRRLQVADTKRAGVLQ